MGDMIIIASYRDLIEAEIVKGRLEAEGIGCALADKNVVTAQPFYSNAIGGVKLKIRPEDYERAKQILAENESQSVYTYLPDEVNLAEVGDVVHSKLEQFLETKERQILFVAIVLALAVTIYAAYYFLGK